MTTPPLSDQLRMGQALRKYISWNPWNYLRPAERFSVSEKVFWSDVDLTDVSFYQKLIDFQKMKAADARGTIIRAGQNLWPDPYFDINWKAAKEANLPRGSYHFYDSRVSPKAQADQYWNQIKYDRGELMAVADFEENYGGSYAGWRNLYDFMERLLANGLPQDKLWIYTGYYYWLDHSPQNDAAALSYFAKFPLWEAWYTTNPANVKIPKPWTADTCRLWQWGTPAVGPQYGVQSLELDMNKWTGDLNSYLTYFNLGGVTPPPNGGPMWYDATGNITMRTGPGTTYPIVSGTNQYVLIGDKVEGAETKDGFLHITRIYRGNAFVDLPAVAWCGTLYLKAGATPPPVEEPTVKHTIDVYSDGSLVIDGKPYA